MRFNRPTGGSGPPLRARVIQPNAANDPRPPPRRDNPDRGTGIREVVTEGFAHINDRIDRLESMMQHRDIRAPRRRGKGKGQFRQSNRPRGPRPEDRNKMLVSSTHNLA